MKGQPAPSCDRLDQPVGEVETFEPGYVGRAARTPKAGVIGRPDLFEADGLVTEGLKAIRLRNVKDRSQIDHAKRGDGVGVGTAALGVVRGVGEETGMAVTRAWDGDRTADAATGADGVSEPSAAAGSVLVEAVQPATRLTPRTHAPKVLRTAYLR